MTIRRNGDDIVLDGVCSVEDAEILMGELQNGARCIDWSLCSHLHAACFQVMLAGGVPVRGEPANPVLARWLLPVVQARCTPAPGGAAAPYGAGA